MCVEFIREAQIGFLEWVFLDLSNLGCIYTAYFIHLLFWNLKKIEITILGSYVIQWNAELDVFWLNISVYYQKEVLLSSQIQGPKLIYKLSNEEDDNRDLYSSFLKQ